jgi:hypothetical protein
VTLHTICIAALFTIVKLWNLPWFPTTNDWIKKMWYIYIVEYYSATKKKEIMSFAGKWTEVMINVLNEIS